MVSAQNRNVGVDPNGKNLWAMARFVYGENLTSTQKLAVKETLLRIQALTNVRFYNATGQPTQDPRTHSDYPYINFRAVEPKDTSSSYVGKKGGKQDINPADFAFWQPGVIEHEICHALGLLHEMCRYDRDDYVIIKTSNLTDIGKANFQKRTENYSIRGNYDFQSIMGYSSMTGSQTMVYDTHKPMYTKMDGSYIMQGLTLSDGDRRWLNYYYFPYIARSDTYYELDSVLYDGDNNRMPESKRPEWQAALNNGNSNPPANGRIPNEF